MNRHFLLFFIGYGKYALDDFKVHVVGWLTKLIRAQDVQEQNNHIKEMTGYHKEKENTSVYNVLEILNVMWMMIHWNLREKIKKDFAYLVERRGAMVTTGQIMAAVWEDELDEQKKNSSEYYGRGV